LEVARSRFGELDGKKRNRSSFQRSQLGILEAGFALMSAFSREWTGLRWQMKLNRKFVDVADSSTFVCPLDVLIISRGDKAHPDGHSVTQMQIVIGTGEDVSFPP